MWHTSISSFVTVLPTSSSSFQSILLKIPGLATSIHTVLYLPTSGKEDMKVDLGHHLDDIRSKYPENPHFLRGDANANPKNITRYNLFSHFCSQYHLKSLPLGHPTYHHFVGNGLFDSEIDVILVFSPSDDASEELLKIVCKFDSPFIESQHDVILSSCSLPGAPPPPPNHHLCQAPRVLNDRVKIHWSDEGIEAYEELISDSLTDIRNRWGDASSISSISVLLSSTYSCLSYAAKSTNRFSELSSHKTQKPKTNPTVRKIEKVVHKAFKNLQDISVSNPSPAGLQEARERLKLARNSLRRAVRTEKSQLRNQRDENLSTILTNPSTAFRSLRSAKASSSAPVNSLNVNGKLYNGESVSDGFYDSLSALKSPDLSPRHSSHQYQETLMDYENVLKIAKEGLKIPPLSPVQATEILLSLRPDVNDLFSITANHFINAGDEGLQHFHFLINVAVENVNLCSLEELNSVWACILFKGHGKNRESDRSYRTISTCPLLAKAS